MRVPRSSTQQARCKKAISHRCFQRFDAMRTRSRAIILCLVCWRIIHTRSDATSGAVARALTLDQAKTLVFLSRCSNRNAVLAIPAGTVRHRHSLMARRAAWRRSERRRRKQRRKRARGRPSAGRRSNDARLSSLRLRTTSMTASHGPARVGRRRAHRDRLSTPPAPVGDGGRRRDRGSGFIGCPPCGDREGRGGRNSAPHGGQKHLPPASGSGLSPTPSRRFCTCSIPGMMAALNLVAIEPF
jgi:hypothetical protein